MLQYEFSAVSRNGEQICITESMANHGLEAHTHDFFEITYITKGKGLYTQNRKIASINRGDLVMVSPGEIHRYEPLTHDFCWLNCIFLPQALCRDYMPAGNIAEDCYPTLPELLASDEADKVNRFAGRHEIFLRQQPEVFSYIFADMLNEYVQHRTGYQEILQIQLRLLLKKISYAFDPAMDLPETSGLSDEDLRLLVQSFFNPASSYAKINLTTIAQKVHVTPKYFSDLFKRKTGCRFSEYILNLRLERAAEMLRTTDANISEVMQYVGYHDSKFFYEAFKAKYGTTPAAYRKQDFP